MLLSQTRLLAMSKDLTQVNLGLLFNQNLDLTNLELVADKCASLYYEDPEWYILAARCLLKHLKKNIPKTFSASMVLQSQALDNRFLNFVIDNARELDAIVVESRDDNFTYFGMKTLQCSYLGRLVDEQRNYVVVETPQYMYLRVAAYLHYPDLNRIKRTYDDLSLWNYSHATPTLFNAGLKIPALSSCFKLSVEDTMSDIAEKWRVEALISKNAGGIGKDFSSIRKSKIGSNGMSKGIVPWIKIDNEVIKATDQSGKRKGSLAEYLCVWHVNILEFLELSHKTGSESLRARELFYGLMVCDLFMKRVENNEMWSLFCPNEAKGLTKTYGIDFEMLYESYEKQNLFQKQLPARELFRAIIETQIETGGPYMLYIDAINRKCNQTHNGDMVHISNLCTEITGVTNEKEIFSCNLASISISSCVDEKSRVFDHHKLARLARDLTRNLNETIDRTYYHPEITQIRYSNMRRRPIGIGVQGLADAVAMLDEAWVDERGNLTEWMRSFNERVFETIYVAAIEESIEMAKEQGAYPSYNGSPTSKGLLQFDLWEMEKRGLSEEQYLALQEDEKFKLKYFPESVLKNIKRSLSWFGIRNSLLVALMPTASTAHLIGNNESFEPFNQMLFCRSTLSGQVPILNTHFVKDMKKYGVYTTRLFSHLLNNRGTIETYDFEGELSEAVSKKLKLKYLGIYKIPQKALLELSAERGKYVCQSQSMNFHLENPTADKISAYHFYGWKLQLKTGMYYLRQLASEDAINYTQITLKSNDVRKPELLCEDGTCCSA